MGEVHRAKDTRREREGAINILPDHLVQDPEARQRFDREARTISSGNRPNICTTYDVGQQDGRFYLVMELLQRETLADRLRKPALVRNAILAAADAGRTRRPESHDCNA